MDDRFLEKLLRVSKSLKKLSLAGVNQKRLYKYYVQFQCNLSEDMLEVRTSWYVECLLPNAKMLTTLEKPVKYEWFCSF